MKKSRFTDSQIVAVLKEGDARDSGVVIRHSDLRSDVRVHRVQLQNRQSHVAVPSSTNVRTFADSRREDGKTK